MSIQNALISDSSSRHIGYLLKSRMEQEWKKGCSHEIAPHPIILEPPFVPLSDANNIGKILDQRSIPQDTKLFETCNRYKVHVSLDHEFDTVRFERFLKQLSGLNHQCHFDIIGNKEKIEFFFFLHESDLPLLGFAMAAEIPDCLVQSKPTNILITIDGVDWSKIKFYDFYPCRSYTDLMTFPSELKGSALESLLVALNIVEPPAIGWYQVVFQTPRNPWGENVEILQDLEFSKKLLTNMDPTQRSLIQSPSGDLHGMASELDKKVTPFKPLYHVAIRLCVIGGIHEQNNSVLKAIGGFTHLFYHGGRPFNRLIETDYFGYFSESTIKQMFLNGLVYRHGFLINSQELLTILNIPALTRLENKQSINGILTTGIDLPKSSHEKGINIGTCIYAGQELPVIIPDSIRMAHFRATGGTGTGKSNLLLHMVMGDAFNGDGVLVIDPHADLINDLMDVLPEELIERIVYLNFGDPDNILLWNPLFMTFEDDVQTTADGLVNGIQSFVDRGGWGDRMEFLFKIFFLSLLKISQQVSTVTFVDLMKLFHPSSKKASAKKQPNNSSNGTLYQTILKTEDDVILRQFWEHDYKNYRNDEFGPPRHKLGKLLSGKLSNSLSQPFNKICFKEFLKEGKIVLVDLSTIGLMQKEFIGCFLLTPMPWRAQQRMKHLKNFRNGHNYQIFFYLPQ